METLFTTSLAATMLLVALYATTRMRLGSLVSAFRLQSVLLALLAFSVAYYSGERQLIFVAVLILVIKAGLIPTYLLQVARASAASERLSSYVKPTTLALLGGSVILLAFAAAQRLSMGSDYIILASSLSIVLLGLILLVSRKDMFGQGIGFFIMENGIFTFGLALTHGMPFLFEIGSLFDLMAFFILITVFTRRAQDEHASVETDMLRTLID